MYVANVKDGYVYLTDTSTGIEKPFYPNGSMGPIGSAVVTDDDEVTIVEKNDAYQLKTKYRISTGFRA